jgi:hypothetical protein
MYFSSSSVSLAFRARRATPVGALNAGVIDEARRRQGRRRLVIAVAVTALVLGVLTVRLVSGWQGRDAPLPGQPSVVTVAPGAVLAGSPYMGVACHVPNSIACDRVGLAVWLRRPAISVSATIDGRPLRLDDAAWSGPMNRGRRSMFAGFLRPVGLVSMLHLTTAAGPVRWLGNNAPSPQVALRIDDGNRGVSVTRLDVYLSAGWG